MSKPLAKGDTVQLILNGTTYPGTVLALSPWEWMLVKGPQRRLYLDVVVNRSSVSWSRLMLLKDGQSGDDLAALSDIAKRFSRDPNRKYVSDIPQVDRLLPYKDSIVTAQIS